MIQHNPWGTTKREPPRPRQFSTAVISTAQAFPWDLKAGMEVRSPPSSGEIKLFLWVDPKVKFGYRLHHKTLRPGADELVLELPMMRDTLQPQDSPFKGSNNSGGGFGESPLRVKLGMCLLLVQCWHESYFFRKSLSR